jgi:two-component system, OmpR family, response regulator
MSGVQNGSAMKILIIEDVDCFRKSLVDYFQDEGFDGDSAADGEEGLFMALNGDYAAIILDLMLPGIDGYEVLRKIRAAGRTIPVIILTARAAPPDRTLGLEAGADDYLVKPFEMDELLKRVEALIHRSRQEAPGDQSHLGLVSDAGTRVVRRRQFAVPKNTGIALDLESDPSNGGGVV